MVSYFNSLSYSQRHSAANLSYPAGQPWAYQSNYHPPPNHQFLSDVDSPHAVPHLPIQYYNHMYGNHPSTDWHSTENFQNATQSHLLQQQHHQHQHSQQQQHQHHAGGTTQLNDSASSAGEPQAVDGLPSPPITVSCGSEISSPGAPASSSSPHPNLNTSSNANTSPTNNTSSHSSSTTVNNNTNRSSPTKSPYYDWMKKQSYSAQPTPGPLDDDICTSAPCLQDFTTLLEASGKTRTKDKYRVVYTDYQRLELEKEYCTSRYITIRRKTELAQSLTLSERQVKIWFQNRRAKERKQNKKRDDPMASVSHSDLASYMDTKPKIEPSLHHLQHSLHHPMTSMAMNMPMGLHHHHQAVLHHGHHLAVPPPQHLHQTHSQMSAAAAASVGSLAM